MGTPSGVPIVVFFPLVSALDAPRSFIPTHAGFTEVGLVRHVAGQRRVVTEHDVLDNGPASSHRVEEIREMWGDVVEVWPAECLRRLRHCLSGEPGVVLLVPSFQVCLTHGARAAARV